MLLILLAAATVAASPNAPSIPPMPADFNVSRTPNLYSSSIPTHCRVGRQQVVDRRIDGCPVVTMMRGDTRPAPDDPAPPPSAYQVMPIRPDKH